MATWEKFMGNILDELRYEDDMEVDALWITIQDQSKEIKELREFISNMGLSGNLPDNLRTKSEVTGGNNAN